MDDLVSILVLVGCLLLIVVGGFATRRSIMNLPQTIANIVTPLRTRSLSDHTKPMKGGKVKCKS